MQKTIKILTNRTFCSKTLQCLLLSFCCLEIFVCLKQVYDGCRLCCVTGTSSSPVDLSLCLSMCLPVLLWNSLGVLHWREKPGGERLFGIMSCACLLFAVVLLVSLASRASWLASFVGCGVVCYRKLQIYDKKFSVKKWHLVAACGIVCLFVMGLYFIRASSADGRLLIWKVTLGEIFDGNVTMLPRQGTFSTFYGAAQERYFSKSQRPVREQMLAGIPDNAYNEWLQMTVEWGCAFVMAVVVAVVLVMCFLRKSKQRDSIPLLGSMWAFVVLSFLSFPLRCTLSLYVALFVMTYGIVVCARHKGLELCLSAVAIFVIPVKAFCDCRHWNLHQEAMEQCRLFDMMCAYDAPGKYIGCYERLKQYIGEEPEYLLVCAKALYDIKRYDDSRRLLRKAQKVSGDPVFYLVEGKCRQEQQHYAEAEALYKKAYYRIPHKIYPLYLLMNLYKLQYKYGLAKNIAEAILRKKPKVKSEEFDFIQKEARSLLALVTHTEKTNGSPLYEQ